MDVYVESQRQDDLCLGSQLPHAGERDPRRVQRDAQNTVYPQNPPYIGQGGNVPSGNPYGQTNRRNGDVRRTQGNHGGANTAGRQYPDGSQDRRQ